MDLFQVKDENSFEHELRLANSMLSLIEKTFSHPIMKKLLESNEGYDAVIVEQFANDALKYFGYHYKAPLIVFSVIPACSWFNDMVGNPTKLSYTPQINSGYPPNMSILQRIRNTLIYVFQKLSYHFYVFPKHNEILKKYFPNAPSVEDLYHNASLVLLNSHESFGQPVPHVPNMIQIGGFHAKPPGTLSGPLKEFLDNSTEGVIYFSMGTNLPSRNLPTWKRDVFLKVFGKLKQKVLWKWEDELPGKPQNVKVEEWLPQQKILAHPNVKLFITHGGLLSNIETIYHGVPTLTIPVFGDQHSNARRAVIQGYSLSIPYHDPKFSEEELTTLLQELLTNPKYRKNVQERSRIFHDRPMHPMDTASYWVDYVIRHRGAPHLRVAGIHLPWYTDLLLDVATIFMAAIISGVLFVYLCVLKLRNVFTKRIEKSKTN